MEFQSLESEYLVALLKTAIKGGDIPPAPDGIKWNELVDLSKKQQVYSTISFLIKKINIPAEQAQEVIFYSQNELVRMIAMKNELEIIEKELNDAEIEYMLVKGSVVRQYYPKQRLRQMSDVDILYKADGEKRKRLYEIMKNRGYTSVSNSENSDDFTKKPYYTFEFHRTLFFEEHEFCPDFSDIWDNSTRDSEYKYKYNISCNDLYLYTVAHMYKHYIFGGFGVRFIVDVYVLLTKLKDELDYEYIDNKLKKMELSEFENNVKAIAFAMFDDEEITDEQMIFANETMSFGIYGAGGGVRLYYNEYAARSGNNSVFGFYLSKLFPDKKYMKRTYPVLVNKPYLLFHYYFVRLFDRFFHSRQRIAADIKQLKKSLREDEKN